MWKKVRRSAGCGRRCEEVCGEVKRRDGESVVSGIER